MAFSVRSDRQSNDPTDSLNFIKDQNNSGEDVTRNLERLGEQLKIDARRVVTCRQSHGDNIAVLNAPLCGTRSADAIITEKPGIFPAIKTADCLPILMLEPQKGVAAAIHAGWRGTVLRITRKVLLTMKTRFGCEPSDMIVALGPAIGACCYEVDDKVLTPFRRAIPQADRFIDAIAIARDSDRYVKSGSQALNREIPLNPLLSKGGRGDLPGNDTDLSISDTTIDNYNKSRKQTASVSHRLDLTAVNRYELKAEGVPEENIFELGLCTSCNPDLFFSYRRDGVLSGRHISLTGFRQ